MPWFTATAGLEAVGDSVARSLMPIVAVTVLGAGTFTVGLISSLGLGAFLLLSLPVGVLADRWSTPRRMMTLSTIVRAVVVALGSAAWLMGWLQGGPGLVVLMSMALVMGVADVAYTTGQGLLVPRLVEPERIRPVFGKVQSASQAGGAAGPALLTGLLAITAAPLAWIAATLLYVASACTQQRVTEVLPPPVAAPRSTMWAEARAGTRQLFAHPVLGRITVANTLNNAAVMGANTLLPVVALRELGLTPAVFAAIGTAGAVSGILGAAAASRVTTMIGLRATRLATSAAMTVGVMAVMLAGPVADVLPGPAALWLTAQAVLTGAGSAIALVAGSDLAARLVPGHSLGTVMGAQRALVVGVMPVAALVIGALGVAWLPVALGAWLALALASAAPLVFWPHGGPSERPLAAE